MFVPGGRRRIAASRVGFFPLRGARRPDTIDALLCEQSGLPPVELGRGAGVDSPPKQCSIAVGTRQCRERPFDRPPIGMFPVVIVPAVS